MPTCGYIYDGKMTARSIIGNFSNFRWAFGSRSLQVENTDIIDFRVSMRKQGQCIWQFPFIITMLKLFSETGSP